MAESGTHTPCGALERELLLSESNERVRLAALPCTLPCKLPCRLPPPKCVPSSNASPADMRCTVSKSPMKSSPARHAGAQGVAAEGRARARFGEGSGVGR